jgi:hypothetical protein
MDLVRDSMPRLRKLLFATSRASGSVKKIVSVYSTVAMRLILVPRHDG